MTKDDYVILEVAKKLKEKGFNEKTIFVYDENGSRLVKYRKNSDLGNNCFSCPSVYQARAWVEI